MNILNNLRTFFLTFLTVIAVAGFFTACNSEQLDLGASGRNLEVHASKPQVVSKAFYTQDGVTRIITPSASNRKLAIVNTTMLYSCTRRRPKLVISHPDIGVAIAAARILKVTVQAISSCVAAIAPCI